MFYFTYFTLPWSSRPRESLGQVQLFCVAGDTGAGATEWLIQGKERWAFNALQAEWTERGVGGAGCSALWPRMSLPVINLDRIIDARQCASRSNQSLAYSNASFILNFISPRWQPDKIRKLWNT